MASLAPMVSVVITQTTTTSMAERAYVLLFNYDFLIIFSLRIFINFTLDR